MQCCFSSFRGNSVLASGGITIYLRGTAETEVDNSSLYWLLCVYLLLYIYNVWEINSGKGETEWWGERGRTNIDENINLNVHKIKFWAGKSPFIHIWWGERAERN